VHVSARHLCLRRGRHGRRDAPGPCGVASALLAAEVVYFGRIPSGPVKQAPLRGTVVSIGACAYAHGADSRTDVYVGV
jgi:hypothetical protein